MILRLTSHRPGESPGRTTSHLSLLRFASIAERSLDSRPTGNETLLDLLEQFQRLTLFNKPLILPKGLTLRRGDS